MTANGATAEIAPDHILLRSPGRSISLSIGAGASLTLTAGTDHGPSQAGTFRVETSGNHVAVSGLIEADVGAPKQTFDITADVRGSSVGIGSPMGSWQIGSNGVIEQRAPLNAPLWKPPTDAGYPFTC